MRYEMKLKQEPFLAMQAKTKTVEIRLQDEKRKNLKCGDEIIFTNIATGEKLFTVVECIYKYANFEELYAHHDKISLGYKEEEQANPEDMLAYYSAKEVEKYGVMGIKIKLVE